MCVVSTAFCMFLYNCQKLTFYQLSAYDHSVLNTTAQLTEGRSARDQPKQPPAKKNVNSASGFGVKKSGHLPNIVKEVQTEIESFHSMLEASVIAAQQDVRIKGDVRETDSRLREGCSSDPSSCSPGAWHSQREVRKHKTQNKFR